MQAERCVAIRAASFDGVAIVSEGHRLATTACAAFASAVEAMLAGNVDTGMTILRDYIKATDGFERLGHAIGTPPKSLIRMLGPRGYLQKRDGLELRVTSAPKRRMVRRAAKFLLRAARAAYRGALNV